jgi:predicted ATPase/class 3 adenylate cyclase
VNVTQPSGTVTFVFTDIEGSTRLLEQLGTDAYREVLAAHRRLVREACARYHGYEVDYEGDAFFYAFGSATDAVHAVSAFMTGLQTGPIRLRVGIHTGEPRLDPPKYVGLDVHHAARIMSAGHGGQVVLSPTTVALLEPGTFQLKALGHHRLKDLSNPIPLHQLLLDGLPHEFPRLRTLYHSTLPVPATPFLGRETELAEVVKRLTDPNTRLLTLTGPGGTGKTRLALQAAAEASDSYPDGLIWVALAPLRDPVLVVPTIAQALEIREHPGEDLTAIIATRLLGKKTLLLLDNAEHLLPHLAHGLIALLAQCPTLRLLVTSRERLQLGAETSWPVPPLTATDGERLFLERTRAAGVELERGEMVSELCRRLDELPLAIELAAARTPLYTTAQLLERLGQRLDLLKGTRDTDPRQHTLRATLDWSYQLLDPEEQRVYRALSVFAGGCTLDAAEHVARADPDTLQSLLDKSLLRRHRDNDEQPRYWMLETIRRHGTDQLAAAGEEDTTFDRFLTWMKGVVGDVDEVWIDRDQVAWLDTLDRERQNLMSALVTCRDRGMTAPEARLLLGAFEFFDTRGPYEATAALLDDIDVADTGLAGRLRCARAFLLYRAGHDDDAIADFDTTYRLAREIADDALAARALALKAGLSMMQGAAGIDDARQLTEEAVSLARSVGDRYALAHTLNALGIVTSARDAHAARDLYDEAARIAGTIGDQRNAALFDLNLLETTLALRMLGGTVEAAMRGAETMRRLGDSALEAGALGTLALAHAARREPDAARSAIARELELMREWRDEHLLLEAVAVLAIAAAPDHPDEAIVLWAAAERARIEQAPVPPQLRPHIDDFLEPLRDHPNFDSLWNAGSRLSMDSALERGLAVAGEPGTRRAALRLSTR